MSTWAFLLIVALYLIPTWVSLVRNGWGSASGFVYWVNLLLGWTIIGWIVILSIAWNAERRKMPI